MHKAHCVESGYHVPAADDHKVITMVMVRRGKCTFSRKTIIAASKGAHAVHLDHGRRRGELEWLVPQAGHAVEMELWMDAGEELAGNFLTAFEHNRRVLHDVVDFNPHYRVFSLRSKDIRVFHDLCTDTSGALCAQDPDGTGPVTGVDVLDEAVRQLCIHEAEAVHGAATATTYAAKWWDYVVAFAKSCPMDGEGDGRFGAKCSKRVMRSVRLDV